MKRYVIYITIALILLCSICLSVLPRKTTFHGTFHGMRITPEGTVVEECDILLMYTKLDYLFREDACTSVEISLPAGQFDTSYYNTTIPFPMHPTNGYEIVNFMDCNKDTDGFTDLLELSIHPDHTWLFIKLSTSGEEGPIYFIATRDSSLDPAQILDILFFRTTARSA